MFPRLVSCAGSTSINIANLSLLVVSNETQTSGILCTLWRPRRHFSFFNQGHVRYRNRFPGLCPLGSEPSREVIGKGLRDNLSICRVRGLNFHWTIVENGHSPIFRPHEFHRHASEGVEVTPLLRMISSRYNIKELVFGLVHASTYLGLFRLGAGSTNRYLPGWLSDGASRQFANFQKGMDSYCLATKRLSLCLIYFWNLHTE